MIAAFFLACQDLFAPSQRRALLLSLVWALLVLAALWVGATFLLRLVALTGVGWLDAVIGILGSLAALWLAWLLFPAMSVATMGFFLDGVAASVEREHYPGRPPPRGPSWREMLISASRLALLAVLINLLALPLYLWPAINLVVYYGLNGYLVAREYFSLVALRRLDGPAERAMWRRYRGRLILAGVWIAFLLSVPIVNLAAPVLATAFLVHLFEGLRREATGKLDSNSRV